MIVVVDEALEALGALLPEVQAGCKPCSVRSAGSVRFRLLVCGRYGRLCLV